MARKLVNRTPSEKWSTFIRPAKDANGESVRLQFRCQPAVEQQINTVILGRQFPYRRQGDLVRDAVMRHLDWLTKIKEVHPNNLKQIMLIEEIVREEEFQQNFSSVFGMTERVVAKYLSEEQVGEATRVVASMKRHIQDFDEGAMREKWMATLMNKFGHLLRAKGAKLRKR